MHACSWEIVLFSAKCEILRTIFQPRALSSDIRASQKGFIYFILWLISNMLGDLRKLCLVQNFSVTGFHKTSLFLWYLLLLPFEIIKKIKRKRDSLICSFCHASFLPLKNRRSNVDVNGVYCLISTLRFATTWPKTAHKIVWKLISGL